MLQLPLPKHLPQKLLHRKLPLSPQTNLFANPSHKKADITFDAGLLLFHHNLLTPMDVDTLDWTDYLLALQGIVGIVFDTFCGQRTDIVGDGLDINTRLRTDIIGDSLKHELRTHRELPAYWLISI